MPFRAIAVLLTFLCAALPAHAQSVKQVRVTDVRGLVKAIADAEAGQTILLADGAYTIGNKLRANADADAAHPIVVRAEHRHKAVIRSAGLIAIEVTGNGWEFRDLEIRGTCANDADCEHAFHVVAASDFHLVGNRLIDFNAHLKANIDDKNAMPDNGVVEDNEIFNTHPRRSSNTVAALNIDSGNNWIVRHNLIYDFEKTEGDRVSYGAYVKGGANEPLFERNLVICGRKGKGDGTRIGLSFGGGGISPQYCAPNFNPDVPCDPEVTGGIMRNNIITSCSDVGIYLNRSSNTKLLFNTLIRTGGIDFRFQSSTGEARGNLLTGRINTRDGGSFADKGNMARQVTTTLEDWYQAPGTGDLRLKAAPTALLGKSSTADIPDDFCGRPRTGRADMGALQSSLGDCATLP